MSSFEDGAESQEFHLLMLRSKTSNFLSVIILLFFIHKYLQLFSYSSLIVPEKLLSAEINFCGVLTAVSV